MTGEDEVIYRDTITVEHSDGRGFAWWVRGDGLWFLEPVMTIVAVRASGLREIAIGDRFLADVCWNRCDGTEKVVVVRLFPIEGKERS